MARQTAFFNLDLWLNNVPLRLVYVYEIVNKASFFLEFREKRWSAKIRQDENTACSWDL